MKTKMKNRSYTEFSSWNQPVPSN